LPTGEAAGGALAAVHRRSLSEDVVDRLLAFVAEGTAPQRRLPVERVLCEQLGVSRATVREALSTLAQLGVVETRGKARYGSLVGARAEIARRVRSRRARTELVDHPLEARRMIEPGIAALAAERGTAEDVSEIARDLELMEQAAAEGRPIVSFDSAFHSAIARASGNPTLVFVTDALTAALTDGREHSFRPGVGAATAIAGHRAILESIRARDPQGAAAAMLAHLGDVESLIRVSLEAETYG
jgi:GntR family transcriptional repressor for pyruvate dehydrogenase complex